MRVHRAFYHASIMHGGRIIAVRHITWSIPSMLESFTQIRRLLVLSRSCDGVAMKYVRWDGAFDCAGTGTETGLDPNPTSRTVKLPLSKNNNIYRFVWRLVRPNFRNNAVVVVVVGSSPVLLGSRWCYGWRPRLLNVKGDPGSLVHRRHN